MKERISIEHLGIKDVICIHGELNCDVIELLRHRQIEQQRQTLLRKFKSSLFEFNATIISYNKVLSQRNALLKYFALNRTFDLASLQVYDKQLDQYGTFEILI